MELEYLIIYTNEGIPIYSRCFANACKVAMGNDILFSAFLSSLNHFAKFDPDNIPDQMMLDETPVTIKFNEGNGTNSIRLEELELVFYYGNLDDVTIAAGYNIEKYDPEVVVPAFKELMTSVESFIGRHSSTNWNNVSTDELKSFEKELLDKVLHPFFNDYDINDKCPLGENCPFRIAIYENRDPSVYDRLRKTVERYRNLNILQKMKKMLFKSEYSLN